MQLRVPAIKACTVRVLVDDMPAGSGFVVRSSGLIATCFHVVQDAFAAPNGQTTIQFKTNISVEIPGIGKVAATPHRVCTGSGLAAAVSADFALLSVAAPKPLAAAQLGSFGAAQEGDEIYVCGHPMVIAQPVVARGLLSTKYVGPGYLGVGGPRDLAWLDLTMNKGNSGGPIVRRGTSPADDRVIGIATFILNPFASEAEAVVGIARNFPGGAVIAGINFAGFAGLVGTALSHNSVGVSGAVSIDHIQSVLAANSL